MAAKKTKKKPEKIPHEEVRTKEHPKYEEDPVLKGKSKYKEEEEVADEEEIDEL
jgi:hypothetical protein